MRNVIWQVRGYVAVSWVTVAAMVALRNDPAMVTPAVWTKAVNACKDLQPPGTLSSKRTPQEQSEGLKFAEGLKTV